MRQVTLAEIMTLAKQAKSSLEQSAKQSSHPVKIYAHWTAGHYQQLFTDYHISISGNGTVYVSVDDLSTRLSHTYRRNGGAIGIALCCAYQAESTTNLGPEPPTDIQIEALAQVVVILSTALEIPIDIRHVMTHAEAAENMDGDDRWHEPYGPKSTVERWDLWVVKAGDEPGSGGNIIRGKALWYQRNGVGI
jgi:hypothetical protein